MKYILIIIFMNTGAISLQDFDSKLTCENTINYLNSNIENFNIYFRANCLPK